MSTADGISSVDARPHGEAMAGDFVGGMQNSRNFYEDGRAIASDALDGLGAVDAYNTGRDFAWGFNDGMNGVDVWTIAWNIGVDALDAIKAALGIASPSREAKKVGKFFVQGAEDGMDEEAVRLCDRAESLGTAMLEGVEGAVGRNPASAFADGMVDALAAREGEMRAQAERLANVVGDAYSPELSARYDARLASAADARREAVASSSFSAAPQVSVSMTVDGSALSGRTRSQVRELSRELATETRRQLASALATS